MLEKNAIDNNFEDELCEYNDIDNDNDFLLSVLHFLQPKPKPKKERVKKNKTCVEE